MFQDLVHRKSCFTACLEGDCGSDLSDENTMLCLGTGMVGRNVGDEFMEELDAIRYPT